MKVMKIKMVHQHYYFKLGSRLLEDLLFGNWLFIFEVDIIGNEKIFTFYDLQTFMMIEDDFDLVEHWLLVDPMAQDELLMKIFT